MIIEPRHTKTSNMAVGLDKAPISRGVPMCTQTRKSVQLGAASIGVSVTAKPVFSGHSQKDKKKTILLKNGSLMKVGRIATTFKNTRLGCNGSVL